MRVVRWTVMAAVVGLALVVTEVALGVGPWPGLAQSVTAPNAGVRYSATRSHNVTTIHASGVGARSGVLAKAKFDGIWGIPAVTSTGVGGGLSPDGRLLVLSEPPNYAELRSQTTFLLLSTKALTVAKRIVLEGEFGFDALSPDGRTMYVIQHTSLSDPVSYLVRAYDLRLQRLLPGAIVAKGESSTMHGYPVSRVTSGGGAWVYTLYHRASGNPFVHALNARGRFAVCIDLPARARSNDIWNARLVLSADGRRLVMRSGGVTVATVDTRTFRVR